MNKKKYGILNRLSVVAGMCLIMFQLAGCGSDSSSVASTAVALMSTASVTPEPYVSTGFPQVVVVSGSDYEMGVQYGNQTAPAIMHNLAIFKSKLFAAYGAETVGKDMQVWDYYLKKYDPALGDWINGIVAGCKEKGYDVSYSDLVLIMVYPTELWSRPSDPYPAETNVQNAASAVKAPAKTFHSCNTFSATGTATADGKPLHAITSMVAPEASDNIILVAFPKNGPSFVSQTYAGKVNSNSAMNSNGFAWTMTAILSDAPAWGLTEVYFHYLAENVTSPAEAEAYLAATPRGGVAGGFMMSDATGDLSVFETSADHYNVRKPGDMGEPRPFLVQTNNLVSPSLQQYNPVWLEIALGTYARNDTVSQFLKEAAPGAVDFGFAKAILSSDNWYDSAAALWHINEPGQTLNLSNDHTSVSQSIFRPADLTAYLQTGTPSGIGLPAYSTGEYVKIKLTTDPKTVTAQADADALAYFWDAADALEHDLNAKSAYLTNPVVTDIKGKLDNAFAAYTAGMDRAGFAALNTNTDPKQRLNLWASALTNFAKAQLYAQMAKSTLQRARGL